MGVSAARLGLQINRNKCEVIGHTVESRAMFTAQGVILPENSPSSVTLLGSPLSAGHQLDMLLKKKREDLLLLTRRLQFMPTHDSLYLLRHVLTGSRLVYLLRTAPCTSSPELPLYDAILRDSQFVTYNVELNDER